jgi:ABC-type bacteriocin/lantibiotic exporter with double-glycine peptidase domain
VSTGALPKIIAISTLIQGLGLALPLLTGKLVDRVLPRGDAQLLTVLLVGAVLLITFDALGKLVRGYVLLHMRTLVDSRLTLGFVEHLVSLPYAYFQRKSAGDLMMRLNANAVVRRELTTGVLCTLLDGMYLIVAIGFLLFSNVPFALSTAAVALVLIVQFVVQRKRHLGLSNAVLDAVTKARSQEVEMLTSMETLKASGTEERTVVRWSNSFVNSLNATLEQEQLAISSQAIRGLVQTVAPLLILVVGATQVMDKQLSLGAMIGLNGIAIGIVRSMSELLRAGFSFQAVRTHLFRVTEVLREEREQDRMTVRLAPRLAGAVELERVSFRYPDTDKFVVSDATVTINPGQFCAIVGRSGSGKSTLAKLILGLYRPASGRILLDGLDVKELDLRSVRQQLGIVSQQFGLFGTGIRDNIALGDPSLSLADVEAAARLACIHDEIQAMPLGYSTPLIDGGAAISGGQKQRLALARALVRNPAILLLDEATSALDAITERCIQDSLDTLKCTRIVIAHRLSTVRRADMILVVDDGRIVELGKHEELMQKSGLYAELVASQLEDSDVGTSQCARASNRTNS